jgi:hypothetical protein
MSGPNLQIQGGNFQNCEGQPLADGYLILTLSHDESAGPSLVVSGATIKVNLDSNGNIPSSPATKIYSSDVLTPAGSYYQVIGYEADGTLAYGPQIWKLTSTPNPLNVASIIPLSPPGGASFTGPLTLETNGTQNTEQNLLNLAEGTGVTITNSAGTTTISASGSGLSLEVNGTANDDQALLNLQNGSGITITDLGSGTVSIAGPSFSGNGAYMVGPGIRSALFLSDTFGSINANNVGGTRTANQVIVYLFMLDVTMTISTVSVIATNNSLDEQMTFGIYSYTGNKLLDGGSFNASTSPTVQTNTLGSPVTISPGTYWQAQSSVSNGTGATVLGILASALLVPAYVLGPAAATAANSLSGGVLPATLGTLTPFTPDSSNGDGFCCPIYR